MSFMTEAIAQALRGEAIVEISSTNNVGDLHSWRCAYPEQGADPCDCFDEACDAIASAIHDRLFSDAAIERAAVEVAAGNPVTNWDRKRAIQIITAAWEESA